LKKEVKKEHLPNKADALLIKGEYNISFAIFLG
jgi:hypothetical protein